MKLGATSYHMLISSLPPLPSRFENCRLPISLERLNYRLRMLEPEDAQEIARLREILRWSQQFEEPRDSAVVTKWEALTKGIRTPMVREVVSAAMDAHMILTALRCRRHGVGLPTVGIGRYFEHIRRNFNKPDFGLGHVFPRIAQIGPMIEQGDVLKCYRSLLDITWTYLRKLADDYYFSFEAVVLYIARWNVIKQWQELQATRGRAIFEKLIEEALGKNYEIKS
ncbi:MAG: DUF2764 family protein [Thermodesulfovibrionales bacterium]|jgi:hypothetical protein